ncbi:TPA: hypothetical protein ACTUNV_002635 [Legionella pneumophila]
MTLARWLVMVLCISLWGCASVPEGNFTHAPDGVYQVMAHDVVSRLSGLHAPAHTMIHIKSQKTDAFTTLLIHSLRRKGYSVNEQTALKTRAAGMQVVMLSYVLDEPLKSGIYRITINTGAHVLSRAWRAQGSSIQPLGLWVYRE